MMLAFNPIKAFKSSLFDEPLDKALTTAFEDTDPNYRGRAIVSDTIAPHQRGRVQFKGSWWLAKCEQDVTIAVGEVVQVVGRQNITLLVKPALDSGLQLSEGHFPV